MARNSLFNELSSIGDSLNKGLVAPADYALQNAKLGLEEKKLGFDIGRQKEADILAKEKAGREKELFDLGKSERDLAGLKSAEELKQAKEPLTIHDFVGPSSHDMLFFYNENKYGMSPRKEFETQTGLSLDDDENSPTKGAWYDKNTGRVVTKLEGQKYIPVINNIYEAYVDPKKFIQANKEKIEDDAFRGRITPEEKAQLLKENAGFDNATAYLKAYTQKKAQIANLPGEMGKTARAQTEEKIKYYEGLVAKENERKAKLKDDITLKEKESALKMKEIAKEASYGKYAKEPKANPFDLERFKNLNDQLAEIDRSLQGVDKSGKRLDEPLNNIERQNLLQTRQGLVNSINAIQNGVSTTTAPNNEPSLNPDAAKKLGIAEKENILKGGKNNLDLKGAEKKTESHFDSPGILERYSQMKLTPQEESLIAEAKSEKLVTKRTEKLKSLYASFLAARQRVKETNRK